MDRHFLHLSVREAELILQDAPDGNSVDVQLVLLLDLQLYRLEVRDAFAFFEQVCRYLCRGLQYLSSRLLLGILVAKLLWLLLSLSNKLADKLFADVELFCDVSLEHARVQVVVDDSFNLVRLQLAARPLLVLVAWGSLLKLSSLGLLLQETFRVT